jgi:hypothetical protein
MTWASYDILFLLFNRFARRRADCVRWQWLAHKWENFAGIDY